MSLKHPDTLYVINMFGELKHAMALTKTLLY